MTEKFSKDLHLDQDLLIQQTLYLVKMGHSSGKRVIDMAAILVPQMTDKKLFSDSEISVFISLLYAQFFDQIVSPFPAFPSFYKSMPTLSNLMSRIGYQTQSDDTEVTKLLRSLVLQQGVLWNNTQIVQTLLDIFNSNPSDAPNDIQEAVWLAAATQTQNTQTLLKLAESKAGNRLSILT